jgi:radical SAM protein (TIGR01212 family)
MRNNSKAHLPDREEMIMGKVGSGMVYSGIRVRTVGQELRQRFGCRVHKIPVHAGMTCPNRDGTAGTGGCIYCGQSGSAAAWSGAARPLVEQMQRGIAFARRRFQAKKFIAYLQAFSNTYGPVDRLEACWDRVTDVEDVIGLSVGTRPDCLSKDVLDLISAYHRRLPYFCLEIGLQSAHDRSLRKIRRGHDFACFTDAVAGAQQRGIPLCAHIILGLPGENIPDMLETVQVLLDLGIEGVKLHHLHVLEGTALARQYRAGTLRLFEMDEYVDLVCRILSIIDGRMIIHRLMGEASGEQLIAPGWTACKSQVQNAIYERCGQGI